VCTLQKQGVFRFFGTLFGIPADICGNLLHPLLASILWSIYIKTLYKKAQIGALWMQVV
jgi:hypothetical protein